MRHFDIIGDIHGHADRLEKLLELLGYEYRRGCHRHKSRKAVFVGDFIDRGAEHLKTLKIVRAMMTHGAAHAVMGNHEFNAICYHSCDEQGFPLRPHSPKNQQQHQETLDEFARHDPEVWKDYLDWFRTLPLYLEFPGFRVIHACWDQHWIDFLKRREERDEFGRLTNDFLSWASTAGTKHFQAIDILLKGKEIPLPDDHPGIPDKDGHRRKRVRLKWWLEDSEKKQIRTFADITRSSPKNLELLAKIPLSEVLYRRMQSPDETYPSGDIPVFIGHYWLSGTPQPLSHNVASLDYSVAKNGVLAAYRWDGEETLSASKFVCA